jgi:CheY-like chemotaxis protein
MRKILLVIDDYTELEAAESSLKRLGFDVLSLSREILVNDALFRFHPDVAILTYKGRSVDGIRLATRLKTRVSGLAAPKVVLVHAPGAQKPEMSKDVAHVVDAFAESPLSPATLIRMIADLTGLEAETLVAKFEKIGGVKLQLDETVVIPQTPVKGDHEGWDPLKAPGQAAVARSPRSDRYDKFLEDHSEKVDKVLSREALAAAAKKLKEDSAGEEKELEKITANKRDFVKALFRTAKNGGGGSGRGSGQGS